DLVVSRVELRDAISLSLLSPPYEPDVDDIVKVEAVITNVGQATATAFDVALFYDLGAAPVALDPADREDGIASLAPGEAAPVSFNITSGAAEVWQMYFLADLRDDIDESNEGNNSNPNGPIEVNWGGTTGLEVLEPNGGETWEEGTTRQIRWNTYGGAIGQPLRIEYSTDGGSNWTDIVPGFTEADDGVYDWDVANENATNCVVRVTSEASGFPADVSDDPFKIIPAGQLKPDLTILSVTPSSLTPGADDTMTVEVVVQNDGYALASPFYVHLFFDRTAPPDRKDLGDRPILVDGLTNVAAGQGNERTLVFTNIRSNSAGVWSMYAVVDPQDYVHELDESDADNTSGPEVITWRRFWLLSPAPGAELAQGSLCTVTWTSTLLLSDLVNIELSTDGGATWATLAWGVPNDGSHGWYVSGAPSTNCRLRISSGSISAEMDGAFTISEPMGIFGGGCAAGRSTHAAASAALLLAAVVLRLLARRPRAAPS
ncbi:MAG: CARDB domain-containing protein, partial [Planctomycetota bacterium]